MVWSHDHQNRSDTNYAWPEIFVTIIRAIEIVIGLPCPHLTANVIRQTNMQQILPVEESLIAAHCVCQSKATLVPACHEQDWYDLKWCPNRRSKRKRGKQPSIRLTKIISKLLHVTLCVMNWLGRGRIHEAAKKMDSMSWNQHRHSQNVINLGKIFQTCVWGQEWWPNVLSTTVQQDH